MCECFACVALHHVLAWCLQKYEKGIRYPGTRVTGSCEQPVGTKSSPLQEPQVLVSKEPTVLTVNLTQPRAT